MDYSWFIRGALVIIGILVAAIRMNSKPSTMVLKKYVKAYKSFLDGAFVEDKKSYKKLVEASVYWDRGQFKKAHKILDKLLKKCICTQDYLVVYRIKSICYAKEERNVPLIETYKIMLQYNMADSITWASLGWIYMKIGKTKEAYDAFMSAIEYDSQNPQAYNNLAIYFIKIANPQRALEYAKKAMELNADMNQPMSTAAIASKMLGDEEGFEHYCRLYGLKGGDERKLRMGVA